jgi:transposase
VLLSGKRKQNLTSQRKFPLRDLPRYNLQTVPAYLLKEDFQQFWEYTSPTGASMFLDFWCYQTIRSRIEPRKKIARTFAQCVPRAIVEQPVAQISGRGTLQRKPAYI